MATWVAMQCNRSHGVLPFSVRVMESISWEPSLSRRLPKKSRTFSGPAFHRLSVGLECEADTATDVGNIAAATEVVTPVGKNTDIVRDAVFQTATNVTEADAVAVALEIRAAADHDIRSEMP